jgi:hypothetical protein
MFNINECIKSPILSSLAAGGFWNYLRIHQILTFFTDICGWDGGIGRFPGRAIKDASPVFRFLCPPPIFSGAG